jgi:gluconolactonase
MSFLKLYPDFERITGPNPRITQALENNAYPFAHEAGVYTPSKNQVFITSNRIIDDQNTQKIQISKITLNQDGTCSQEEIHPDIPMANGGVNYRDGVLFCSQGTATQPSSLIWMQTKEPYRCETIIDSFYGRQFNSLNDVVVHSDGTIWFTDPIYGFEQKFRPQPQLPSQVYRYDPETKSIRAMADGFERPNGISFSPDEKLVYVTDTDFIHGDGSIDLHRASTMSVYRLQPPLDCCDI